MEKNEAQILKNTSKMKKRNRTSVKVSSKRAERSCVRKPTERKAPCKAGTDSPL